MKRVFCLILSLFVILVFAGGCSNRANDNSVTPISSSTIASEKQTGETADVPLIKAGQEKKLPTENKVAATVDTVGLLITKDFGEQILFKKQVAIDKSSTVIDVLKANLNITTKWDGSYVSSINGLESQNGGISGNNLDWFYYINGICSDAGAADYSLRAGEVIWWDYHKWQSAGFANSAVIGCYPEPFIHGYRGKVETTTIMSSEDNLNLANEIEKALKNKGVNSVATMVLDNSYLEKTRKPAIVIGTWDELKKLDFLDKFNKAYRKTGASVHFTDEGLELLDYKGNVTQSGAKSAGIIVASGSGLGDDSPLWLVAGTDPEGLQQAVDLLVKTSDKISGLYNAAILSGEVIRLPLQ
ncbi:MAG: hypothetical protein CVU90_04880 [Firmicutes bacterium HGW-Firmicutes-15]|nr:MAG: hypothetical protein CVU90_04880 [Firmicutes bacterium HGW-Firmicutes-15]